MKVLRKLMVVIASIVLGVSVGMLIQIGRSYYTVHGVQENLQHRFQLSMQQMKAFMNFKKPIRHYAGHPNSNTKRLLSQRLNT